MQMPCNNMQVAAAACHVVVFHKDPSLHVKCCVPPALLIISTALAEMYTTGTAVVTCWTSSSNVQLTA